MIPQVDTSWASNCPSVRLGCYVRLKAVKRVTRPDPLDFTRFRDTTLAGYDLFWQQVGGI